MYSALKELNVNNEVIEQLKQTLEHDELGSIMNNIERVNNNLEILHIAGLNNDLDNLKVNWQYLIHEEKVFAEKMKNGLNREVIEEIKLNPYTMEELF